jgi:hypothetical protein
MTSLATPSSSPDDRRALRIGGPPDLLDALPRLLGYLPRRSAVLVALRPPGGRLVMTMRVDLPPPRQEVACARLLAGHAQRSGATSAVLVVYDDRPAVGSGRWRGASLARAMRVSLRQRGGLRLQDALTVQDGRWRSLLCRDEGCCPPAGLPLRPADDPSPVAAALAVEGAAVLPDREALVATVAAPAGASAARLRALHERLARPVEPEPAGRRLRLESFGRFVAAVEARRSGVVPSEEVAVRLVLALHDVVVRDAVLCLVADDDTSALLALLLDLAVVAVEPFDAPVLTTLAWVAYARGDGTLANIAVERALQSDPAHSLARLLGSALQAGVHPKHLRRVSAQARQVDG